MAWAGACFRASIMVSMRCASPERYGRERTENAVFFPFFFQSCFVVVMAFLEKMTWSMCYRRIDRVHCGSCAWPANVCARCKNWMWSGAMEAKPYGRRCNPTEIRESIFNYTHYVRRSLVIRSPCVHLTPSSLSFACRSPFFFCHFEIICSSVGRCQHSVSDDGRWHIASR